MRERTRRKRLKRIVERFEAVNAYFIGDLALQVAKIRDEDVSDLVLFIAILTANIAAVNAQIESAVEQSKSDIQMIYDDAVKEIYGDYRKALQEQPLSDTSKAEIDKHTRAVGRDTARIMRRLARANNVSKGYQEMANKAITARTSGLGDYHAQMRPTVRDIGRTGIRVADGNGKARAIASAVSNSVLDGVHDIQQYVSDVIAKELKFDAVEISVHEAPAPDHEPIQGNVFMRDEFEKLQGHLPFVDIDGVHYPWQERAIGEMNCRHLAFPFSTKTSVRRYSPQDLRIMRLRNKRGCWIGDKHYTLYEAEQYQKRLEAARKRQEDIVTAAQAANDTVLEKEATDKIKTVTELISNISKVVTAAGNK